MWEKPKPALLAAVALLVPAAIWGIAWAAGPTAAADPHLLPGPKAVARAATSPEPAPTTSPEPAPAPRITMAPGSAVVVGIGDSVTSATVCECTGFMDSYAAQLPTADGGPAREMNLGTNGLTAARLRSLMTTHTPTAEGVAQGDILLVTIGANDLTPLLSRWRTSGCPASCYSPAVDDVGSDVGGILTAAKDLRGHRPTQILVTGYWNVFADGDIARTSDGPAYLRWSDEVTRALNSRICAVAQSAGAVCVDLYSPFKGDGSLNPTAWLAADGDHPNTAGNQLISAALLAATSPSSR